MVTIRDELGGTPQNFCTFDTPYLPCFMEFLRKNFNIICLFGNDNHLWLASVIRFWINKSLLRSCDICQIIRNFRHKRVTSVRYFLPKWGTYTQIPNLSLDGHFLQLQSWSVLTTPFADIFARGVQMQILLQGGWPIPQNWPSMHVSVGAMTGT